MKKQAKQPKTADIKKFVARKKEEEEQKALEEKKKKEVNLKYCDAFSCRQIAADLLLADRTLKFVGRQLRLRTNH